MQQPNITINSLLYNDHLSIMTTETSSPKWSLYTSLTVYMFGFLFKHLKGACLSSNTWTIFRKRSIETFGSGLLQCFCHLTYQTSYNRLFSLWIKSARNCIWSGSTRNWIWSVATTWIGLWTWIWSTRHCGLGKKWLVDFSAGKTQLVSFDRSSNNGSIDVNMNGSVLEVKSYLKMLVLTFSSKLDWGS